MLSLTSWLQLCHCTVWWQGRLRWWRHELCGEGQRGLLWTRCWRSLRRGSRRWRRNKTNSRRMPAKENEIWIRKQLKLNKKCMRLLVCTVFTHQKSEDKATTADLPPPNLSFFLSSLHCRRCVPTCVRLQWSSSAVLAPEQLHVNMLISQIQVSVICLFSTGYIYVMHCSYNPVLRWCRQNKKQFEVGGNKTNSVLLQFVVYVCVCVCVCMCVRAYTIAWDLLLSNAVCPFRKADIKFNFVSKWT
jgi:hypothetical protein